MCAEDTDKGLIDYGNTPEIYCSGVQQVDVIDQGVAAMALYRNEANGERIAVGRVFIPISAIRPAFALALIAIGDGMVAPVVTAAKKLLAS